LECTKIEEIPVMVEGKKGARRKHNVNTRGVEIRIKGVARRSLVEI
jgi:hypothetical protein